MHFPMYWGTGVKFKVRVMIRVVLVIAFGCIHLSIGVQVLGLGSELGIVLGCK